MARQTVRCRWWSGCLLTMAGMLAPLACYHTPIDTSDYAQGPAPLRTPSPGKEGCSYEDSLTGGRVFEAYCASCHNARALAERPFSNYKNVAAHMRERCNLTGKEYAKLVVFLRQFHDVPPPNPPVEPSLKRFFFGQPIPELREQSPAQGTSPKPAQE